MKRTAIAILATLLTMASTSFAATQVTGAAVTTVAPTMQVKVNVLRAVSLTLATGATAPLHCAVTSPGPTDYTMDFGTVDAMGINAGNCNQFKPATPGTNDAIYWSDYQLVPVYTSHKVFAGTTITAQVTGDFAAPHNVFIVRDSANSAAVPANAAAMTPMGVAAADTIGAAGVVSGTALTRYIGVGIHPTNSATEQSGALTATVTFTLTVQ